MDEERINVVMAEAFLKEIMTREKNKRIVNNKIIPVEAKAPEEEDEVIMRNQTRNNTSATIARGTDISVMNAIVNANQSNREKQLYHRRRVRGKLYSIAYLQRRRKY